MGCYSPGVMVGSDVFKRNEEYMVAEMNPSEYGDFMLDITRTDLSLQELSDAHFARRPFYKNKTGKLIYPDGVDTWTDSDYFNALVGEVGEYANWQKELLRGNITQEEYDRESTKELADIVSYAVMLADRKGVNLSTAIRDKFNEVSDRVGCPVKI